MLVGLCGKKRSGKDTVAKLIRGLDSRYISHSFAESIKKQVAHILGLSIEDVDELKTSCFVWQNKIISGRRLLREIGMLMVELQPNILIDEVQTHISNNKKIIITDVRMANEAVLIKNNNGIIVQIINQQIINDDDHITELIDFPVDYTINNDYNNEHITEQILSIFKKENKK